jgi:hypothetical protein
MNTEQMPAVLAVQNAELQPDCISGHENFMLMANPKPAGPKTIQAQP